MSPLLVFEHVYLDNIANAYQTFRTIVDEVLRAEPYSVLADDHTGDLAASLARQEPRLVEDVARYVGEGNADAAFQAAAMSVAILERADPWLFDTAARETAAEEIYALRRACDGQEKNASLTTRREDYRWWEAVNGDRLWRRRELYRLRHLKAARAKKVTA